MIYFPQPIDTSRVQLPDEVLALAEQLAANAHENWAAQRLHDGWIPGPVRSDALKQHPCLIPYDQLPDSERVYDRRLALETLRTITALGFRIEKVC